jgi:hypothetical protein
MGRAYIRAEGRLGKLGQLDICLGNASSLGLALPLLIVVGLKLQELQQLQKSLKDRVG